MKRDGRGTTVWMTILLVGAALPRLDKADALKDLGYLAGLQNGY